MVRKAMNRIAATSVETCFTALIFLFLSIGAAMSFNAFFYPTSSLVLTKSDNYENINVQEPIKYGDQLISHPLVTIIPGKYIESKNQNAKNQNNINNMIYIELQVQNGVINQINMNGEVLKLDSVNSRGVVYKNDQTTCIVNQILSNTVLINIRTAKKKTSGVMIFSNDNCIFHVNGKQYPVLDVKYNSNNQCIAYGAYSNTRMLFWQIGEVCGICQYNIDPQNKCIYMSKKSPEFYLNDDNTKIMIRPYLTPYGFDVNADASQIERVENRKSTLANMGYDAGAYIEQQWRQIYPYSEYFGNSEASITISDSNTTDPVPSHPIKADTEKTHIVDIPQEDANQDAPKPDIPNQELSTTKPQNSLDKGPAKLQNNPNETLVKNASDQITLINKPRDVSTQAITPTPQPTLTVCPSQQNPRPQVPETTYKKNLRKMMMPRRYPNIPNGRRQT